MRMVQITPDHAVDADDVAGISVGRVPAMKGWRLMFAMKTAADFSLPIEDGKDRHEALAEAVALVNGGDA